VLYLKKNALVHPTKWILAEQKTRARSLTERRLIDVRHPARLSPETLAHREVGDM
jgi:predicted glycosyltransferase